VREAFRGYYPPTDEEFDKLWSEGLIVLDANALLHLFRYSASARDELIDLLEKYQDRIWIPHQVGAEFHRIRRQIPVQENKAFDHVESVVRDAETRVLESLSALQRPTLEAKRIAKLTKKHMRKIAKGLRRIKKEHLAAVLAEEAHARTFATITDLYDGRVGRAFDGERLKKIQAEGTDRFARKVPPGYADGAKDPSRKFGDLILWMQMLDEGSARKLPMLFITDDAKEDWWDLSGGRPNGPRAELIEEYYAATDERVHFYSTRDFLEEAKQRGEDISDETVEETRRVSSSADFRQLSNAIAIVNETTRSQMADILAAYNQASGVAELGRKLSDQIADMYSPQLREWAEQFSKLNTTPFAAQISEMSKASDRIADLYWQQSPSLTDSMLRVEREWRDRQQGLNGVGRGETAAEALDAGDDSDDQQDEDPSAADET